MALHARHGMQKGDSRQRISVCACEHTAMHMRQYIYLRLRRYSLRADCFNGDDSSQGDSKDGCGSDSPTDVSMDICVPERERESEEFTVYVQALFSNILHNL